MGKRQQSKAVKRTCLSCKTTYDPNRYKGGCPNCQRDRINAVMAGIRQSWKRS